MHNGIVAGVAVASLTIGAASGYFYAVKKLNDEYNAKMEAEIERTKDHYKRVYKLDEYATPQDMAEALGVKVAEDVAQAVETMAAYGKVFEDAEEPVEEESDEVLERNVFDEAPDILAIDKERRDKTKPYAIDITEYLDVPDNYEQVQLTYYAGDNVLGDDKDDPIADVEYTVGSSNLIWFGASDPEQPHILLVRNDKLKMDFEITYSDGKFAHQVLGFQHSDEPTFQRNRPRPRREE